MREGVKGQLEPEVTGTGSDWKCGDQVIWFGKPLTSGTKKDRGLRSEKERTFRDAYMT